VDRDFFAEKISWNETQSKSQLAALTRSVQAELEGYTQILDLSFPVLLEAKKPNYGSDQAFSQFHAIARLSQGKVESLFTLTDSPSKDWVEKQIATLVSAEGTGQSLFVYTDAKHKPWVVARLHSRITQDNYAVVLEPVFLQSLLDRQKGQAGLFAIVNEKSQVLAHSEPEYLGLSFADDPLTKEALRSSNVSGSGLFDGNHAEKSHSFFERVEGANLFVEVQTPLRILLAEKSKLKQRFLYLGLGLLFLGVFLLLLLEDPDKLSEKIVFAKSANSPEKPTEKPTKPQEVKKETHTGPPPESAPAMAPPATHLEVAEEAAEEPAAMAIDIPKTPPMAIPAPPEIRGATEEKFADLFADKKIQEAFAAIDSIESPPPIDLQEPRGQMPPPIPSRSVAEVTVTIAPPPPPPPPPPVTAGSSLRAETVIVKPQIELPKKETRAIDEFTVTIRKPKPGSGHDVG
jgi:hypothetical protein